MSFLYHFRESANKAKDNVEVNKVFIEKRKAGAAKIAKQATIKGGYSSLTAAHFKAKEKPYEVCLKSIENSKTIYKHIDDLLEKIKKWENMTQMEFQKIMGQLEAYGEVAIQLNKPKEY